MTSPPAALITRIDARLSALGLSDRQASIMATGKPDAIRDIRRGRLPNVYRMVEIARVLGTTVEWLVTGE